jgi:phage repressor protein C with HTH and peptisase S24 domain
LTARWRSGRTEWLELHGWSMAPSLRHGDWLKVAPLSDVPETGELVTFQRGERLVVHRLVRVEGSQVITRGDAVATDDAPIALEDLLGRVVEVRRIPRLQRWVNRMRRAS